MMPSVTPQKFSNPPQKKISDPPQKKFPPLTHTHTHTQQLFKGGPWNPFFVTISILWIRKNKFELILKDKIIII